MKIEWNKVTWYSKFIAIALFLFVFALAFWLGVEYRGVKNEVDEIKISNVSQPIPEKTSTTYINEKYGFEFEYPREVKYKSIESPSKVEVMEVVANDYSIFSALVSDTLFNFGYAGVTVISKPENFTNLAEYVQSEIEKTNEAGKESAAGLFVSDANPVTVNGVTGVSFSVHDGSAVGNTSLSTYFEKGNYIYMVHYSYSAGLFQGLSDPPIPESNPQRADEIIRVNVEKAIVDSFKFI